jgi:hypothetical protein
MSIVDKLLNPEVVWVFIPLAAIALGGVLSLAKLIIRHRERMARIGMGMDPDYPPPNLEQPQQNSLNRTKSSY